MKKYYNGKFTPKNPDKWINIQRGIPITYRSGWELRFMSWADTNPSIIKIGSETLVIPYVNPLKKAVCRYFPDFFMEVKEKTGKVVKYVIEVKPEKETAIPQKKRGKKASSLLYESATYIQNLSKWASAQKWCEQNGILFKVVTEKELGV